MASEEIEDVVIDGRAAPLVAEFDQKELTVLIAEAFMGMRRPRGATVDEALASMRQQGPEFAIACARTAHVVMEYFAEGMRNARRVQ